MKSAKNDWRWLIYVYVPLDYHLLNPFCLPYQVRHLYRDVTRTRCGRLQAGGWRRADVELVEAILIEHTSCVHLELGYHPPME